MAKGSKKNSSGSNARIDGGVGASDANNGGGAGSGSPDADTGMRVEKQVKAGDVKKDREKLFPDATKGKSNA